MRRWLAKALTTALVAAGIQGVAVANPAWACGCGAYLPGPNGSGSNGSASVAREQALIRFDGTTEDVIMRFSVKSDSSDAAWVMPVPSQAKASLGTLDVYSDLDSLEAPLHETRHYLWPHLDLGSTGDSAAPRAAGAAPGADVNVLADEKLGAFEVASLAASDPTALSTWLNAHGFTLKPATADRLAAYTAEGWQFVAVRLASGSTARLEGALDPIRITFAAEQAVYPMRLSAGATAPQNVEVSILAPHRMTVSRPPVPGLPADSTFGDWVDPAHVGPDLRTLAGRRMFLTVFEEHFYRPEQITQDYAFTRAPSDRIQHPTVYTDELLTVLGIPVYLLILLAAAALIISTLWWLRAHVRSTGGTPPAAG